VVNAVVDALARVGKLEEALTLAQQMPLTPERVWRALGAGQ
jgi:pentatricopeptide repeat protein